MTINEIKQLWNPKVKNSKAAVEFWNSKASSFAAKDIPNSENSLAMRLISENHMINSQQTVLDIGCGSGRFSFALEQLGARVTGTDFSPRMIEECEKMKNMRSSSIEFCVQDWQSADLYKLGWHNNFDLVLANMTPSVDSADTFLKLSEASRNWCIMVKPTRRSNAVHDRLNDIFNITSDTNSLDKSLLFAFELLWLKGMNPKIEYQDQTWQNSLHVDDAIREYILRTSMSHTLSNSQKETISEFLHSISVDNIVQETTHTTIAALYWQVQ